MSNQAAAFGARASVGFAGTFVPLALQLAFLPVWLSEIGFSGEAIGTLLGAALAARIVAVPPLVTLSDRFPSKRLAFVGYAALTFAAGTLLLIDQRWAIVIAVIVVSVGGAALVPIADSVALGGVRSHGLRYGRMRLWGSLAFVAATLGGGWWIERAGFAAVPFALVATLALSLAAGFALPATRNAPASERMPVRDLVRDRVLLVGIVSGAVTVSTHATFYAFASIHWATLGFDATLIGWFWTIGVVAEVALFAAVGKRFSPRPFTLLACGALAAAIRWATFPLNGGTTFYVVNSVLHAGTFAAAYLGTQQLIADRVKSSAHGAAQGLTQLIAGPTTAILTVASGWLYARHGAQAFLLPAAIGALAFAMLFLRLQPQRAGEGGDTIEPE